MAPKACQNCSNIKTCPNKHKPETVCKDGTGSCHVAAKMDLSRSEERYLYGDCRHNGSDRSSPIPLYS